MWRHGDVLIAAVETIPEQARLQVHGVLVYGEVTGHSHRLESLENASVWTDRGELFVKVTAPTRIIHEEHLPITLPPGSYRVWQQREYTPESIRTILD